MKRTKPAPWSGGKTERLFICVTAAEKRELKATAAAAGGISVSRYLLNLHHKAMGRLAG